MSNATESALPPDCQVAEPPYTLGDLLRDLEASDSAYAATRATADRIQSTQGSIASAHWYVQAEAFRWQHDLKRMPGIERIELICDRLFGSGITAENVRRLRAKLCDACGAILPRVADQYDLISVANLTEGRVFPLEWTDATHCPGCGTPTPVKGEYVERFDCEQCGGFTLHTCKLLLPVGKLGAPPVEVSTGSPYWQPIANALDRRQEENAQGEADPKRGPGRPTEYDPMADDAYLAKWAAARDEGMTAQQFETREGDDLGTVEKTQARVRKRKNPN